MTYQCPKCLGTGEIAAHRNVLNGVCFKCNGAGTVSRKPATPSQSWTCVYAGAALFNIKAKTEAQALRRAVVHWKLHKDAPAFANVTSADDVLVQLL